MKRKSLVIGGIGWAINLMYWTFELYEEGWDEIQHHFMESSIEHAVILSLIPLFMIIGNIFVKMEEQAMVLSFALEKVSSSAAKRRRISWYKSYDKGLGGRWFFNSPFKHVFIIAVLIFFSELFVMLSVSTLPALSLWVEALIDATLLVTFLGPTLYFFLFKPMAIYTTDRIKSEEYIAESEERYRTLFEDSRDAVYVTSRDGNFQEFNKSCLDLLGYSQQEIQNITADSIYVDPSQRQRFQEEIEKWGSLWDYPVKLKKKNGTEMDCLITASLKTDDDGNIRGYQGSIRDITEQKESAEALKKSKEFIETALNSMNDAVSIINVDDYTIVGVNKIFLDQLGLTEEEVIGKTCYEITHHQTEPCSPPNDACPLIETMNTGEHAVEEHVHLQKDGENVFVEVSTAPIKDDRGNVVQVVHVARDITERKIAEDEMKRSLKEKEVLLREIHHRVKNNLQIITSLLNLQSRNLKDIKTTFKETQRRIESIALVHEKLYQSKDLANIDFGDYTTNLVSEIYSTYGVNPARIPFIINMAPVDMKVDIVVSCGLIINEIVTNSLKYAFPDGVGEIVIELMEEGDDTFVLTVSDNGVGIPENMDIHELPSLGIRLVLALIDELDGQFEIIRDIGTKFKITFPKK